MRQIPHEHFALAVLISLGNSSGSGFLYRTDKYAYLVTAKHVLFDEQNKLRTEEIEVACQSSALEDESTIRYRFNLNTLKPIFHKKNDVTIIQYGSIIHIKKMTTTFHLSAGAERIEKGNYNAIQATRMNVDLLNEVLVSNDIFVFGYPTSLGIQTSRQFDYTKPLLRKGVVANIYKETDTIILDCPVYGGNSGGPVIQIIEDNNKKRYRLIGVISQYIPYVQRWSNDRDRLSHIEYLNSGYSVATSFNPVLELIESLE